MGGPLAGFDPAAGLELPKGAPEGLQAASRRFSAAAENLTTSENKILNTSSVPGWQGNASLAYSGSVSDYAAYTNQSSDGCLRAASAATVLSIQLKAAQDKAKEAIARLVEARATAAAFSSAYDAAQALPAEERGPRLQLLSMEVADFQGYVARLRAQVAEAHDDARRAADQAAGTFAEVSAMAPSRVAARTERILAAVRAGDYSVLQGVDLDHLSVQAQEEIAASVSAAVRQNLDAGEGLDELRTLSEVVNRYKHDDEFATSFYNTMGGTEASLLLWEAATWYREELDSEGLDDPALLGLMAPFATMLGTATRTSGLRDDFTDDFLQRDWDFDDRDHLAIGFFLLAAGNGTKYGSRFLAEAGQDLVVDQDAGDMTGTNPYVAPPVEILELISNNPGAAGLLLTGASADGIDNMAVLLMKGPYYEDDGTALGDVITAGAHDLRYTNIGLANEAAYKIIQTAPEFSDHLPDGMKRSLVTVLDDHIGDFEYVATRRAVLGVIDDSQVEIHALTYEEGHEYLKMLFGDSETREPTAGIIGERVGQAIFDAADKDDTEYANRAGALSQMGVQAAGEADLDDAEAEDTANKLKAAASQKLLSLTPVGKIPLSDQALGLAFDQMFPTDHVRDALEEQGAVQIDELQSLRGLTIATKVELGHLPPEALNMVSSDGTVTPDLNGDGDASDILSWDLDGDGSPERVTERDIYDMSHDLSGAAHDAALNLADVAYAEKHPPSLEEMDLPDGYSYGTGTDPNPSGFEKVWEWPFEVREEGIVESSTGLTVAGTDDLVWDPVEHVYSVTFEDASGNQSSISFRRIGDEWSLVNKVDDAWVPVP